MTPITANTARRPMNWARSPPTAAPIGFDLLSGVAPSFDDGQIDGSVMPRMRRGHAPAWTAAMHQAVCAIGYALASPRACSAIVALRTEFVPLRFHGQQSGHVFVPCLNFC